MRTKSRLTITLPEEILQRVDNLIDGNKIRNRSHAIETLILNSLTPNVTTAVILAGGNRQSKQSPSLKKISGRYLLSQQIDHLKSYGITKVFICAGGFQSQIKEIFGDGSQMGVTIAFVSENKPMGTAGALKLAEGKLREEPFVVVHGDVLTDLNLREFIDFHLEEGSLATIGVKPRMGEKNYGQAFLHGNKIIRFLETGANQGISIVNTGLYVFSPEILERIPEGKKVKLESDIFPALAAERQLSAFIFQGNWNDVLTK